MVPPPRSGEGWSALRAPNRISEGNPVGQPVFRLQRGLNPWLFKESLRIALSTVPPRNGDGGPTKGRWAGCVKGKINARKSSFLR